MIFICLGTQKFEFNRLLEYVDNLIEKGVIKSPVFAQTGSSTYLPKHYDFMPILSQVDFNSKINECEYIITHGGVGSILTGLKSNKKVIALPRLKKFNEHVDDHQKEICDEYARLKYILTCSSEEDLADAITNRLAQFKSEFSYSKNIAMNGILEDILQYIEN